MHESVDRVVSPLLSEADRALGGRYSAVLYGSAARGGFIPGHSDVNLMLILEDATPEILRSLGKALTRWRRSRLEPPLLMSRQEWERATDAFPIEITDMRAGYQVLRGVDPLTDTRVLPSDLRRALEREFRGKLLRLRQGYAAVSPDPASLGVLATQSAGTILVLLRTLLTLLGRSGAGDPIDLAHAAEEVIGAGKESVARVVRHRGKQGWRCGMVEFEEYMAAVECAVRFLDQLQLGDRQ
jgi:predicted nucleotidyltransferase